MAATARGMAHTVQRAQGLDRRGRLQALDALFRWQYGRRRLRSEEEPAGLAQIRERFERVIDANAATAASRGGVDQVVFGWIETASADLVGGVLRHPRRALAAVGLAASLPSTLVDVAGSCLADPGFLADIGLAAAETRTLADRGGLLVSIERARSGAVDGRFSLLDESLRPRDESRARVAVIVGLLALELAFLHDLQHVLGGHTSPGSSPEGRAETVFESRPKLAPAAKSADRCLFELQADTWAMTALARLLGRGHSLLLSEADVADAPIDPLRALVAAFAIGATLRHELRPVDEAAEDSALDHADPAVAWLAVHRSVTRNLSDDEPAMSQALHALEEEGSHQLEWLRSRWSRGVDSSSPSAPGPGPHTMASIERAEALCEAIRTRHPRLRWMHRLVIEP